MIFGPWVFLGTTRSLQRQAFFISKVALVFFEKSSKCIVHKEISQELNVNVYSVTCENGRSMKFHFDLVYARYARYVGYL